MDYLLISHKSYQVSNVFLLGKHVVPIIVKFPQCDSFLTNFRAEH